jgi:hypothetical protein
VTSSGKRETHETGVGRGRASGSGTGCVYCQATQGETRKRLTGRSWKGSPSSSDVDTNAGVRHNVSRARFVRGSSRMRRDGAGVATRIAAAGGGDGVAGIAVRE